MNIMTPEQEKQMQENAIFERKLLVMKLLQKMKLLKKKNSKPYKDCQKQIWMLTHPNANKDEEYVEHTEA